MRSLSLLALPLLAAHALAQATVTEYVTVEPSPAASSASLQHKQALSTAPSQSSTATAASQRTTFATSAASTTPLTSSYSLVQATSTVSLSSNAASATGGPSDGSSPSDDGGGDDSSGSSIDTNAGASGSGAGSGIGKGGMIAIIVVVVVVALFGIASTILFVVAKRRQWNIRASIARASRRLTGRFGDQRTPGRSNRRTTVNAGRLGGDVNAGHKRGLVVNVGEDVEKGPLAAGTGKSTRPRENTWVQRLWGNDWK